MIDGVVVHQGGEVNQLDNGGQPDHPVIERAGGPIDEEQQGRAEHLALHPQEM